MSELKLEYVTDLVSGDTSLKLTLNYGVVLDSNSHEYFLDASQSLERQLNDLISELELSKSTLKELTKRMRTGTTRIADFREEDKS